jgi:hypothetical protein
MTELVRKLGIQPGARVCLLDAPPRAVEGLRDELPPEVTLLKMLVEELNDVILFWPYELDGLNERLRSLQFHIRPQGAIWVVMPKKKYARASGIDFTWEEMQAAGLQTDLVDNKVASISGQEYGTRFVIRKDRRDKYGANASVE